MSPSSHLDLEGATIDLTTVTGVYLRTMDHHLLPEVHRLSWGDPDSSTSSDCTTGSSPGRR